MHSALGGREEGALVMLELCPTRTPLAPLLAIALRLHFDKLPNASRQEAGSSAEAAARNLQGENVCMYMYLRSDVMHRLRQK